MPATRRPIIDLRAVITAREPLVVDHARLNAIDHESTKFLRSLATWLDVHKRELAEHEESYVASVQQTMHRTTTQRSTTGENKTAVEQCIGSKCYLFQPPLV